MDSRGRDRSFGDCIVSAPIQNGVHHRHDHEAALGYVVEKMLMRVDDVGQLQVIVFGGFEERPDQQTPDFNPPPDSLPPLLAHRLGQAQELLAHLVRRQTHLLAVAGQHPLEAVVRQPLHRLGLLRP